MVDPSQLQHGPCHPGDSSDNATQPSGANSIPDNVWATPGYNFYSFDIITNSNGQRFSESGFLNLKGPMHSI